MGFLIRFPALPAQALGAFGGSQAGEHHKGTDSQPIIDGVGGETEKLGQQHDRRTGHHGWHHAVGTKTPRQEECETQREEQRHGTQTKREEPEVVDKGATHRESHNDGQSEYCHNS